MLNSAAITKWQIDTERFCFIESATIGFVPYTANPNNPSTHEYLLPAGQGGPDTAVVGPKGFKGECGACLLDAV